MIFIRNLEEKLDRCHLLKHDFYKLWNCGHLDISTLQVYATEYYHHVAAFPRYISAIHSNCSDIKTRQILLGNLIEEEQGDENHPKLWKNFAEGIGANMNDIKSEPNLQKTKELVDGYFDLVKSDFAVGMGILYAYERQTPAVSKSKIEGLRAFYRINDEKTLKFFETHIITDEWHTEECAKIIENLSDDEKKRVTEGAEKGAKLLWGFLDGMLEEHNNKYYASPLKP